MTDTTNQPLNRDLMDDDGENRAVRWFLAGYTGGVCNTERMRNHLEACGFPCWPDWAASGNTTLTKSDAQDWLRYLFSLEASRSPAAQEVSDEQIKTVAERHLSYVFTAECEEVINFARALLSLAAAPSRLPRAIGVSRDAESPGQKSVLVAFERALSDDELRELHIMLSAAPSAPQAEEAPSVATPNMKWAKWILQRGRGLPDHACKHCVPHSDMLMDDFICAFHEANAAIAAAPMKGEE